MSENSDVPTVAAAANSVADTASKLPASTSAPSGQSARLFGRQKTVHELLGGGKRADLLLWKQKYHAIGILAAATLTWFLLQKSGYTVLSLVANALLVVIVILFVWANLASLLNRSPPPLPEMSLSEDFVYSTAKNVRQELNKVLAIVHDVALGKDFKLFLKVIAALWIVSTVAAGFTFFTLAYLGILGAFILPVLYNKYENEIDKYVKIVGDQFHKYYQKLMLLF